MRQHRLVVISGAVVAVLTVHIDLSGDPLPSLIGIGKGIQCPRIKLLVPPVTLRRMKEEGAAIVIVMAIDRRLCC